MSWILTMLLLVGCVSNQGPEAAPKGALLDIPKANVVKANPAVVQKNLQKEAKLQNADPCLPQSAFALGQGNRSFEVEQCPLTQRSQLRRAFETGKEVAVIEKEIKANESKVSSLRAKILDPQTAGYERRKMQTTLEQVERRTRRSERELYDLKRGY